MQNISEVISSLISLDKTVALVLNDVETLDLKLSETKDSIVCSYTNEAKVTITSTLAPTNTFDDLVMFCVNGSLRRGKHTNYAMFDETNLIEILRWFVDGLIANPKLNIVERLSNYLRIKKEPLVWTFGEITVTMTAEIDGIWIDSDNPDFGPPRNKYFDEESLAELMDAIASHTVTGTNDDGSYISSQHDVFEKLTATLQYADSEKGIK